MLTHLGSLNYGMIKTRYYTVNIILMIRCTVQLLYQIKQQPSESS